MVEDCTISCQTFTLVVYISSAHDTQVYLLITTEVRQRSHIVQYAARLYFVCKSGTELEGPVLEHLNTLHTFISPLSMCARPLTQLQGVDLAYNICK